jgi:hypothetical protein
MGVINIIHQDFMGSFKACTVRIQRQTASQSEEIHPVVLNREAVYLAEPPQVLFG